MIKIFGHPQTSAGRCYWTLEEIGLEYEAVPVNMREKEHKTEEFLGRNPNGKVPYLEDGGLVLWESMAIDHYLAEKYRPGLLGKDIKEKAKVIQWSFWSLAEYQKPMIDLFIQEVFVPEGQKDVVVMTKSKERIEALNRILDSHLNKKTFMVGEDFTLADLHVASVVKINSMVHIDISGQKSLARWFIEISKRPAYVRVECLSI